MNTRRKGRDFCGFRPRRLFPTQAEIRAMRTHPRFDDPEPAEAEDVDAV